MEAIATVPFEVEFDVPAKPTEESQDYKGIDHPLWSCVDCKTVWRGHERKLCPGCECQVGDHVALDQDQTGDILDALVGLDGSVATWDEEKWDLAMWKFRNLIREHVPWYDLNSRLNIQACYEALCAQAPHPKIAFAIAFFEDDYAHAPEEERTFCPEVPYFARDAQYDLQHPSW